MSLESQIKKMIDMFGPMDLGTYMQMCLTDHKEGYYIKRSPIGKDGDFITAPEISQMFGELLGAWIGDLWQRAEKPSFTLLECGPGRGTLMLDILRVSEKFDGFADAADIYLLEMSPVLRKQQKNALDSKKITWVEDLRDIPTSKPIICIANEFLDALPIRQLVKDKKGWMERAIIHNDKDPQELSFDLRPAEHDLLQFLPEHGRECEEGEMYEISPDRMNWLLFFSQLIKDATGIALFIDYGYDQVARGDTFQAVKDHSYADPLKDPGASDLTAHVDFSQIAYAAEQTYLSSYGPVYQGEFLKKLGIEERARILKKNADNSARLKLDGELGRLTSSDQMGELFKVMAIANQAFPKPEGF